MPTGPQLPLPSFHRRATFAALVLLSLSVVWSLSTPMGGGPDERDHASRGFSAVGGTLVGGETDLGGGSTAVEVAAWITRLEAGCYAFHTDQPVSCAPHVGTDTTRSEIVTRAGQAPPLYHLATGLPLRAAAGRTGLFGARLWSAAVAAALVGAALSLASFHRNRVLLVPAVLLAWTPTAAFLSGVLNPSTWEIAGAALTWVAGVVLIDDDYPLPVRIPATGLAVGASVLVLDRQLSPVILAVAATTLAVAAGWNRIAQLLRYRSAQVALGVIAVASVAAAVWMLAYRPLEAGTDIRVTTDDSDNELAALAFGRQSLLLIQMIAWFGWLDLRGPSAVTSTWLAAALLLVTLAALTARRRDGIVLAALVAVTIALPTVIEATSVRTHGQTWQGRYTLPLALGIVVFAAARARIDMAIRPLVHRLALVVCGVVAVGHFVSFGAALRRNSIGTNRPFWETMSEPVWSPPTTTWLLLLAAAVSAASLGWLGSRLLTDSSPDGSIR